MPRRKKHSSGLYRKSITIGHESDGTRIRRFVYGDTIAECEEKIAQIRIDRKMGVALTDRRSTWGYWADTWKAIKGKNVGKTTQDMYASALKHLERLRGCPASELTPLDIAAIVSDMAEAGYAKHTIKIVISTASQICALARRNHAMILNITEDVKAPKTAPEGKRRALSRAEQDAIWGAKPLPGEAKADKYRAQRLPMARMMALMTLCCGLRRGEVIALPRSRVDLKNACLLVEASYEFKTRQAKGTKTKAGIRKAPIPKRYLAELSDWLKERDSVLVFPGRNGGYITESEYERLWDTLLDAINGITVARRISAGRTKKAPVELPARKIEFTSHDLRHTFATEAAAKGVDIKTLQYMMGHEKAETLLDIYAHFSPEAWSAAAQLLNGDGEENESKNNFGDMTVT